MKKEAQNDPGHRKTNTEQHTVNLDKEEIERLPDSDDDYRLPRELPAEPEAEYAGFSEENIDGEDVAEISDEEDDDLIDEDTDISPTEIALLEEAERDNSSDETLSSDMLDDVDDDGDRLNEGPDEDNLFDTGADLDMPDLDPDPDIDDEQN